MRLGSFMLEHYFCGEKHYFLKTESKKLMDKKAVRYTAITLGIALCSCSVPHWLISQKNIATDVPEGCGKTVVSIMEYPKTKKKSRFFVHQYMRQDTLWNLSEKSFAVFYDGEWIQPKVRVGNHRIKEPTTIPPMTSFAISFKSKRQTGDTIHIIERNTPRQGDSIVMKVSLSEPGKRAEYSDYENYFSFNQLSHNPQNIFKEKNIYDKLEFEDSICIKELVIGFPFIHKNILDGELAGDLRKVMTKDEVPRSALSFHYKTYSYEISISNDCDISCLEKPSQLQDEFMIRIKFYQNVMQPFDYTVPFAIIEEIKPYVKEP